jgi:hypothetical protein
MASIHLKVPLVGKCGPRRVLRGWTTVRDDETGRMILGSSLHLAVVGYAIIGIPGSGQHYLHRVVFEKYHGEVNPGFEVDHIDRDKLNNTPENLRAITSSHNKVNTGLWTNNKSGYKGVSWHSARRKWRASLRSAGKQYHYGLFDCKEDAARKVNEVYASLYPNVSPPNKV